MQALPSLKEKYIVVSSDVDYSKRIRLSRLFDLWQDLAGAHATNLGMENAVLVRDYNAAWVLAKMRVEFDRVPTQGEKLSMLTWPQAPKAIYQRDYEIESVEQEPIVRCVSHWVIMDLETRQLLRNVPTSYRPIQVKQERAIGGKLRKIAPPGELKSAYNTTIHYSMLDVNGHVNNARYIDLIMDCFPLKFHLTHSVRHFAIDYLNEVSEGQEIRLESNGGADGAAEDALRYFVQGVAASADSSKKLSPADVFFRCEIEFRDESSPQ